MSPGKGMVISFFDQSVLSLANFLIGVFMIKSTAKSDYGTYALACAVVLFVTSVQSALITTQMTVLAPRGKGEDRERFCSALAAGQYLIFLPPALLAFAAAAIARHVGLINITALEMVMAVSAASVGVLLREFFRGFFFRQLSPGKVLAMDLLYLLLLSAGLAAVQATAPGRLHVAAVLVTGAASFLAGAAALFGSGMNPLLRLREILAALAQVWQQGKWALAGVAITWLQDQSYIYLLTILAGSAATAEASASRLFLAPVALLNTSFARTLLPRWAALRHSGENEQIRNMVKKSMLLMTAAIIFYVAALLLLKDHLVRHLVTGEYGDLGVLIMLWSFLFLVQAARSRYSWLLQVFQRFGTITGASAVSAFAVLLLGLVLIGRFGARGSIMALAAGEVILALLLRRECGNVV